MTDDTTIIQQKAQKELEELLNIKPEHPDYQYYFQKEWEK